MEDSRVHGGLWNKYYITLLFVGLITSLSSSMLYTIVSAYAVEIGSTLAVAGIVAGIFFHICTGIATIFRSYIRQEK